MFLLQSLVVALTKVTVAVFKVWEVLTAGGVRVRRMRTVTRRGRGRVRGGEQQPGRPRDHVQHPVTNSRPSRHQGLHRPLNIGLNVLKTEKFKMMYKQV